MASRGTIAFAPYPRLGRLLLPGAGNSHPPSLSWSIRITTERLPTSPTPRRPEGKAPGKRSVPDQVPSPRLEAFSHLLATYKAPPTAAARGQQPLAQWEPVNELPKKVPLPTAAPSHCCRTSVPDLLPGPSLRTPWTLLPALSAPQSAGCGAAHRLPKCRLLAAGVHSSPRRCPGSGSPASLRPAPDSPPRRALAFRPAAGTCGDARRSPLHPPRQPFGDCLAPGPGRPPARVPRRALRARPGRGAASVCARRPGSAAPAPAARARAGRGGSEAGLSPARRGAASLLRRRSLLPPPPPSRSLVLAGAAQTCSGAAAPARIGSGLRPWDPAKGAGGDAPRRPGPLGTVR